MQKRDERSELDWLALQISALYRHDKNGRITRYNGPPGDDARAPFFFFGRTRLGNLWRIRAGLPEPLVRDLARWAALEKVSADLEARPERFEVMRARIEEAHPVEIVWGGPAFRFPDELHLPPREGEARLLVPEEMPAVAEAFDGFEDSFADREPWLAVWREGRPVSIAYCATVPGAAGEVGVETLAEWRGHGYAGQAVLAWAREMRARGVVPLYSTGWDNEASRAVARKLELIPYGSNLHLR